MAKREYDNPIDEVVDRVRRMETKVTKLLDHAGLNTDGMHAVYTGHALEIPAINMGLQDMLDKLPPDVNLPVLFEGRLVAFITRPRGS